VLGLEQALVVSHSGLHFNVEVGVLAPSLLRPLFAAHLANRSFHSGGGKENCEKGYLVVQLAQVLGTLLDAGTAWGTN